ncbi:MAG: oxygen-dependent coproporphyrinogen oxidase [Balneolales bacterium]|nr:oxygen-dependent coproporphyrinogen oxidase [Balneolales bacterium]
MSELLKDRFCRFIYALQDEICEAVSRMDGKSEFREDLWEREGGGGGRTRVIEKGKVFEKGGVNCSVVHGELPDLIKQRFKVDQGHFFAAGISLVLHPYSPMVPTVHANYRMFELYDEPGESATDSWFGGGADLTPYYLFEEDARHFHRVHKDALDTTDRRLYPEYKEACDRYFHNAHRNEARGIGGIFFDYLREENDGKTLENWFEMVQNCGNSFISAYLPIVDKRQNLSFTKDQKYWQEIRRGRYVEFNLVHDRGTLFGLKTNGRIESILMSLPPVTRWDYDFHPKPGSREENLVKVLQNPVNWV